MLWLFALGVACYWIVRAWRDEPDLDDATEPTEIDRTNVIDFPRR